MTGDETTLDDYAEISRIVLAETGGKRITVAGISQYGTQAAGEYLADPQRIVAFAKGAPKG
jgi:hypothetical protein